MAQDLYRYDKMVENALRGVVREALSRAAQEGLRGGHHFYIGFVTQAPGVVVPQSLLDQYPEEMTIVVQHQFWDLEVRPESFSVTLSFQRRPERLTVPFSAVRSFADPSVQFGLQFEVATPASAQAAALPAPAKPAEAEEPPQRGAAEVVALDKFRKR